MSKELLKTSENLDKYWSSLPNTIPCITEVSTNIPRYSGNLLRPGRLVLLSAKWRVLFLQLCNDRGRWRYLLVVLWAGLRGGRVGQQGGALHEHQLPYLAKGDQRKLSHKGWGTKESLLRRNYVHVRLATASRTLHLLLMTLYPAGNFTNI